VPIQIVVDAGAVVTALGVIGGGALAAWRYVARPTVRRLQAIGRLVEHELQHDHGHSMKDQVERLERRLDQHMAQSERQAEDARNRRRWYDKEHPDAPDRS